MEHHRTLVFLYIVVIEQSKRVGERRFQSWITLCDVQRVAVVGDGKQVGHTWLGCRSAVVEAQLTHIGDLPTEVGRRSDVGDVAHCINIYALVILNEIGLLWLHLHSHVEVVVLAYHSQHHVDVVYIVLIFRISAEVGVEIVVKRSSETTEFVEINVP